MKHANESPMTLGISGRIAAAFQNSAITPLLALLGLLLGLFAILVTPKEEEPQIDVTFADVFIPFPGATPAEVENLVTLPAEQVISEIKGIDTLYSFSQPDGAMIIVIFKVGVTRNDAIVSLYNQIYSNMDKLPQGAGVGEPLIKPRGIDDVPIVSLTLWSKDKQVSAEQLTHVAQGLETEIKRISGTREIYTVGQHEIVANVRIDPAKMNSFNLTYDKLRQSLNDNNHISMPASLVQGNQEIKVQAGQFLQTIDDVKQLVVSISQDKNGKPTPVYLADIADISLKSDIPTQSVWHSDKTDIYPAVTIAIGKQPGQNAVDIADATIDRIAKVKNVLIPSNVEVTVSRNYGETAADKSNTLILKLIFATSAVVVLVFLTMGARESLVVGVAIIITLAITLFASWAWGFTLNRVSLFALIFSIGILVDDAIVVVENIHRHMALGKKSFSELIPVAVDEVGGPTILATFTVIAALLPMAFVSGLMGPYMSPIPINASMGMLISLVVAFVVTPWLSRKLLKHHSGPATETVHSDDAVINESKMVRLFTRLIGPFLLGKGARKARIGLAAGVFVLIGIAVALPIGQLVVLKMLPFDNKSEFQVMVDMPEGTPVEQTQRVLQDLSRYLATVPEVEHLQLYAGTNAPMNFNGLVRHYFLRNSQELGDIQVNLVDKKHRKRDSHSIALSVREELQQIGAPYQANIKVVEVPPGPPVWSPIVAEVYGPSPAIREQAAYDLQSLFRETQDVVDIDIFLPAAQQKWQVMIDRSKASLMAVPYSNIVDLIATSVGGKDVSYLHIAQQKHPVPIRLQLQEGAKIDLEQVLNMKLQSQTGQSVPVSELVTIKRGKIDAPIIHKNMIPMVMVVADMAGPLDSPLYGMFDMAGKIDGDGGLGFDQHYIHQPTGLDSVAVLWDGEWKITYETFRDMGIAYAVGMIAIYLLVVAQFRSYLVPLIIMAPIPLTVIGVMPGHALLGAQFTATSMIGMIALAGIIVRNSILLVDFINQETASGVPFERAVIHSGAVRAKPIMLTALAAMIGALFILDDPIFNGLAISLIFGIFISTLLTLIVIPVLYYAAMKNRINLTQTAD
ncbi:MULTISPECIES: efflux RND transporter permease subunit [Shewanella]|uniref:efflux RND transporter permease subunit n=1 Tax=Shewanella TaxID=22 RepID=UPI00003246CD|nr:MULTISPECIES: efflux RND transporter permease subunit [Shewanella]ASF13806.1 AcrB/AcrD/AcrF family protein [Shewanella sp. FDAARGOS_354]MDH1625891.1 efflux RND transporter permease subunit [Shewanella xiamenensis]MDN5501383.1 efflux RND transporter permease subunit [Shewanella sp.]MDN5528386.1 efflux RND transporter permease subunit [Shewanella sp.]MDV5249593.1 efflux RND transporter permease subunit [Shewanella xiamenensis]